MKKIAFVTAILSLFGCGNNIGTAIPDFSLQAMDGTTISRADLKGKASVVVIWATWCGDCIREIPELNALAQKYKDNDKVMLLAFSDEDEAKVAQSLQRRAFNFTHIVNSKDYTDQLFNGVTKHFPQVLVVNDELQVVFDVTENRKPIFNDLDNQIQQILAK